MTDHLQEPRCNCEPFGFSAEYDGPNPDCPIHGEYPTHLQDCPLSQPCREQKWTGKHRPNIFNKQRCAACDEVCICERLRAHGKRVLTEAAEIGFRAGRAASADDAAVQRLINALIEAQS